MKTHKLNDYGAIHYLALGVSVSALVIGGVFVMVLRARHAQQFRTTNVNTNSNSQGTINSSNQSQSDLSTTSADAKTTTNSSSNTSKTTPKTTGSTTTNTSNTPSSDTKQPVTPLSALTAVIYNLHNGVLTNVTAQDVAVPGPISTAQARPIVFTANGKTYFAYRQGQTPNFDTSAEETANTMAIVEASGSYTLDSAYLGKTNKLTNSYSQFVGYSTGGN